jgi:hypothetical protein
MALAPVRFYPEVADDDPGMRAIVLIERLNRADAEALGIDTDHTTYTLLSELATATVKARRDAPSIAVCEV